LLDRLTDIAGQIAKWREQQTDMDYGEDGQSLRLLKNQDELPTGGRPIDFPFFYLVWELSRLLRTGCRNNWKDVVAALRYLDIGFEEMGEPDMREAHRKRRPGESRKREINETLRSRVNRLAETHITEDASAESFNGWIRELIGDFDRADNEQH